MSSELDFASPSAALDGEINELLEMYEDPWCQFNATSGISDLDLEKFLFAQYKRSSPLDDATIQLSNEVHMNRIWGENTIVVSSSRITDIACGLDSALFTWEYGMTVWESVESVVNLVNQAPLAAQVCEVR